MEILKVLGNPQWWRALMGSEFNQGFMAALVLILALMLVLLILRGILFLVFRTRRCSTIVVKRQDGNTVVARDVVASVVNQELIPYPALSAEKIQLTRKGKEYQLTIYCRYLLSDQAGLPSFCDEFKPRLKEALQKGFGINTLTDIRLWILAPDEDEQESLSRESGSKDAYTGL
jgi:hypothetical protein